MMWREGERRESAVEGSERRGEGESRDLAVGEAAGEQRVVSEILASNSAP